MLLSFQNVELIREGLYSYQDEIRSEALGLLCVSHKKAGNSPVFLLYAIYNVRLQFPSQNAGDSLLICSWMANIDCISINLWEEVF